VSDEKRSSGVQLPAKPKLGDQRKKKRKNGPMGKSLFILSKVDTFLRNKKIG
jgi:hypothetical protein